MSMYISFNTYHINDYVFTSQHANSHRPQHISSYCLHHPIISQYLSTLYALSLYISPRLFRCHALSLVIPLPASSPWASFWLTGLGVKLCIRYSLVKLLVDSYFTEIVYMSPTSFGPTLARRHCSWHAYRSHPSRRIVCLTDRRRGTCCPHTKWTQDEAGRADQQRTNPSHPSPGPLMPLNRNLSIGIIYVSADPCFQVDAFSSATMRTNYDWMTTEGASYLTETCQLTDWIRGRTSVVVSVRRHFGNWTPLIWTQMCHIQLKSVLFLQT